MAATLLERQLSENIATERGRLKTICAKERALLTRFMQEAGLQKLATPYRYSDDGSHVVLALTHHNSARAISEDAIARALLLAVTAEDTNSNADGDIVIQLAGSSCFETRFLSSLRTLCTVRTATAALKRVKSIKDIDENAFATLPTHVKDTVQRLFLSESELVELEKESGTTEALRKARADRVELERTVVAAGAGRDNVVAGHAIKHYKKSTSLPLNVNNTKAWLSDVLLTLEVGRGSEDEFDPDVVGADRAQAEASRLARTIFAHVSQERKKNQRVTTAIKVVKHNS